MTLSSEVTRVDATGDGIVETFFFNFRTLSTSHVKVYLDGVLQSSGYSVALNEDQDSAPGGSVTFLTAPDAEVRIQRTVPLTQTTNLTTQVAVKAEVLEDALDRAAMQTQQLARDAGDRDADILDLQTASDALTAALSTETNARQVGDAAVTQLVADLAASGTPAASVGDAVSVLATGTSNPRLLATRFSDVLNILDFGAVGDGVTDDADAIEAAIAAAPALSIFASRPSKTTIIFFPTPSVAYRVTREISLPINKNLHFVGEGREGVVLTLDSVADDYVFRLLSATSRSVVFQRLWFDKGGIYYETNCRTYHRISECRFTRCTGDYAINSPGSGVVGLRIDRTSITECVGGINIGDQQSDLISIEKCIIGGNSGVDVHLATSGVTVTDCDFESKAVGAEAFPYVHIERNTLSPGLQIIFDKVRFGNEDRHPASAVVIGPLGSVDDLHSTSPIWFTSCVFKGATGGVPSDTNGRDAFLLNMGVKGLKVIGCSFWTHKHFVNEAAVLVLGGSRGTYGNIWAKNSYMGSPTVAAFTKNGLGWEIDDDTLSRLFLPGSRGPAPTQLNRFASTELDTGWTITAGLTVAKNATGPDGQANSAFTITRTATGSQNVSRAASGTYASGVATVSIWLKAGTVSSARVGLLAGGIWHSVPDIPLKLNAEWTLHTFTTRSLGPADTITMFLYHDADAAAAGTILAAFPNCNEGAAPQPYVPALTNQHSAGQYQSLVLGFNVVSYGNAAPGAGRYEVGDLVFNTAPTAGGGASPFIGWVCVTAGSPGTWKTFGAISA